MTKPLVIAIDGASGSGKSSTARGVAARLGLVLAGIDLKLSPRNEYVVLEANSGPVYLDIEMKTGAPITAAIIRALTEGQP